MVSWKCTPTHKFICSPLICYRRQSELYVVLQYSFLKNQTEASAAFLPIIKKDSAHTFCTKKSWSRKFSPVIFKTRADENDEFIIGDRSKKYWLYLSYSKNKAFPPGSSFESQLPCKPICHHSSLLLRQFNVWVSTVLFSFIILCLMPPSSHSLVRYPLTVFVGVFSSDVIILLWL